MPIKVIVTGATGMVGEGVMNECLLHPEVEQVLIVNRRPSGHSHPKLKEIVHQDFMNLSAIKEQFKNYDACFFCLGVSSVGMKEPQYYELTYTLSLHFAKTLVEQSSQAVFCYISGSGTDSTEKGRLMWARVKGKTENDLMKLPFKRVYAFRPGYMHSTPGLKYTNKWYRYISWMYPFLRAVFPNFVSTLKELGLAMINVVIKGYDKNIIEVKDIKQLAMGNRQ